MLSETFAEFGEGLEFDDDDWVLDHSIDYDDYDPSKDPEFVDEDEDVKDVLRSVYKFKGDGLVSHELPVPVPFATKQLGMPNPYWDKVGVLISQSDRIRALVKEIKDIGEGCLKPGKLLGDEYDMRQVMEKVEHLRPVWKTLVDEFIECPLTPGVMPNKPPAEEVYSRLLPGTSIYDVGLGTGEKLKKYAEDLVLEGCDPKCGNHKFDRKSFGEVGDGKLAGKVLTSYNSLTQLSENEQEKISYYDGVHVFPNIKELSALNVAVPNDDGTYSILDPKGKVWKDRPFEYGGRVSIKQGYYGCNTFSDDEVGLQFEETGEVGQGFATLSEPGKHLTGELGHKFDGEMVKIEVRDGKVMVRKRNGKIMRGAVVSGRVGNLSMLCEEMSCEGKVVCYILIRLLLWGKFVPFHGGAVMEEFVKRKRLVLNGSKLIHSPPYDESAVLYNGDRPYVEIDDMRLNVDGVIERACKIDYYEKYIWTVDIQHDEVHEVGKRLQADLEIPIIIKSEQEGLWEYKVEYSEMGLKLEQSRPREDKTTPNAYAKIRETVKFAME